MDPRDDVLSRLPLRDERDHLRLGEDRAEAADLGRPLRLQRKRSEFVEIRLQRTGHHLKEAARSRGALVVHREVRDPAVFVHHDGLAVLATDVDQGADGGVEKTRPGGVAHDLGHRLVGKGDTLPAVPCGDDPADLRRREAQFRKQLIEDTAARRLRVVTGKNHPCSQKLTIFQDGGLGGNGADIDPGSQAHITVAPPSTAMVCPVM